MFLNLPSCMLCQEPSLLSLYLCSFVIYFQALATAFIVRELALTVRQTFASRASDLSRPMQDLFLTLMVLERIDEL